MFECSDVPTKAIDDRNLPNMMNLFHEQAEKEEKEKKARQRKERKRQIQQDNLAHEAARAMAFKRFNAALSIIAKNPSCDISTALAKVDALLSKCGLDEQFFIDTAPMSADD